ncbi:MAG: PHP domain-containing protein [Synergistaceae bacterium]|jgi:predicted metal-dependent phosphoesterase TrpH|nr:PHP domain-containing protein [Synergistaceae bacterium]
MLKIDLHLHSSFSDGALAPDELVRRLKERGVSVASLTDHDTAAGVDAFLSACRGASIRGVVGVEVAASNRSVLHILGYRFDMKNAPLADALKSCREERVMRNLLICERLRSMGFSVTTEEAAERAGSEVVGRPHIAMIMWEKGYVPNVKAAFDLYLKKGAPAYFPRRLPTAEEWIGLIRGAGGLPVMAHPIQTTPNLEADLPDVLTRLKDAGLWGLECWFARASATDVLCCLSLAERFGLYPTAGSDFHGGAHHVSSPGVAVSDGLLPWAALCGGL